jgi:hypothetical protein
MVPKLSAEDAPIAFTERGGQCAVGLLLADLDEESRTLLETWIDDPRFTAVAISDSLKLKGIPLGPWSLNRHRRRICKCRD